MKRTLLYALLSLSLTSGILVSCKKDSSDSPAPVAPKTNPFAPLAINDTIYVTADLGDSTRFYPYKNDKNITHADSILLLTEFYYTNTGLVKTPKKDTIWGSQKTSGGYVKKNNDSSYTVFCLNSYQYIGWSFIGSYQIFGHNEGEKTAINSSATVVVKMGTDEQFATKALLEDSKNKELWLFAVDGDTTIPRKWNYSVSAWFYDNGLRIDIPDMSTPKYFYFLYRVTIGKDGKTLQGRYYPEETFAPAFKLLGEFKSKALDKNGKEIEVSGQRIEFDGKQIDYVRRYW